MKVRNDFVSNSSSCSFIIHVATQEDLDQLAKPENAAILDKYADYVASDKSELPYGSLHYYGVDSLNVGEFVRLDIGDDSSFDYYYHDPTNMLIDIFEKLNKNYGKLKHYADNDAHVTIGEYL